MATPLRKQDLMEFFQSGLSELDSEASSANSGGLPALASNSAAVALEPTPLKAEPISLHTSNNNKSNNALECVSLQEFQQYWESSPTSGEDLEDFAAFADDLFDDNSDHISAPSAAPTARTHPASTSSYSAQMPSKRAAQVYAHHHRSFDLTYNSAVTMNGGASNRSRYITETTPIVDAQIHPQVVQWLSHQLQAEATKSTLVTPQVMSSMRDSTSSSVPNRRVPPVAKLPSPSKFGMLQMQKWNAKYKELLQFRQTHGHALVPLEYKANPQLAHWVKRQRAQHKQLINGKKSVMTTDRIQLLEQLDFIWDSHRASWEGRWSQLKQFRDANNHTNVSISDDQGLSVWMKCQRRQYKLHCDGKTSSMTVERIQQLNLLGFAWSPRR